MYFQVHNLISQDLVENRLNSNKREFNAGRNLLGQGTERVLDTETSNSRKLMPHPGLKENRGENHASGIRESLKKEKELQLLGWGCHSEHRGEGNIFPAFLLPSPPLICYEECFPLTAPLEINWSLTDARAGISLLGHRERQQRQERDLGQGETGKNHNEFCSLIFYKLRYLSILLSVQ